MDPSGKESILRARLFIERNLHSELSGERIAEQAFRSYYRFHHQFKDATGESLWQYVKRLRLEKASFLLKYTAIPVGELAFQAGFESTAAFSKAFTSWFGVSPVKFRNKSRTIEPAFRGYQWNDVRKVRLSDEKIYTFRSEGIRHFPEGYFKWKQLCGAAPNLQLIGKSPDHPGITGAEKIRWDTSVPKNALTGPPQPPHHFQLFEETLLGGSFLKVPFEGFGRPLTLHMPNLLGYLRDQGLEWRPSGRFFQTIREHAEKSQCLTDLFIPIGK